MGLSYGWQKFHGAINSLTSDLSLRQRLNYAIAHNLIHLNPEDDLPQEIILDFKAFISFITNMEAKGDEGTISATINSLTDEGLANLVTQIVSMHDTVCRAYGKNRNG